MNLNCDFLVKILGHLFKIVPAKKRTISVRKLAAMFYIIYGLTFTQVPDRSGFPIVTYTLHFLHA